MSSSNERTEYRYVLGSCLAIDFEPKGDWCVFAIDFNKQEYWLGGIVSGINHGQEIHLPISMVEENSRSLGFRFPTTYGEIEIDGILRTRNKEE